jgi:hypothetical protein
MSVYTTIFAGSTPIGSPVMGALASTAGVAVSLAVSGSIAAVVGLVALVWVRRRRLDRPLLVPPSRAGAEVVSAGVPLPAPARSAARYASGAPSTSAAFNPPKPNEVLSTRR